MAYNYQGQRCGRFTQRLRGDPGYTALQTIPGVGPLLAAVFVAEIGDIDRFARPQQLASWAGLTPTHHESDTIVHRGRITKMGCGGRGPPCPSVVRLCGRSPCRDFARCRSCGRVYWHGAHGQRLDPIVAAALTAHRR